MSHTILFVDDDVLSQWIMSDILTQAGFGVTSVCLGAAAAELMQASDEFDLLLTDLDLPDGINGMALSTLWRGLYPTRPVIFTSSQCRTVASRLHGNEAFVPKPFDSDTLLRIVDLVLQDQWLHPAPTRVGRAMAYVH